MSARTENTDSSSEFNAQNYVNGLLLDNNMPGTVQCISFPEDVSLNVLWPYEQKIFLWQCVWLLPDDLSTCLLCFSAFVVLHETVNQSFNFIHLLFRCLIVCYSEFLFKSVRHIHTHTHRRYTFVVLKRWRPRKY